MHTGDRILCPHCGEHIIVKTRAVRNNDGWKSAGQEYFCMFCTRSLGPVQAIEMEDSQTRPSIGKLAALLNATPPPPELRLDDRGPRAHFCRDCAEFIAHPFLSRCQRHGRDADPMGDCPDFTPKKAGDTPAEAAR